MVGKEASKNQKVQHLRSTLRSRAFASKLMVSKYLQKEYVMKKIGEMNDTETKKKQFQKRLHT